MNILHLSHHQGCFGELAYVASQLGFTIESMEYRDGYNISAVKANTSWEANKERFNSFDVIITSDTAPLARIILQHMDEFKGHLVIWVCNRFDYVDNATNDCDFPDREFYDLFRAATENPRVTIAAYTPYESFYSRRRAVDLGPLLLRPTGRVLPEAHVSTIPPEIDKSDTFFIPPYHNDNKFINLEGVCKSMHISTYRGRYSGPQDLAGFKGIIHIPYAWSNFALFENWQHGMIYFIPSMRFLLQLGIKNRRFRWAGLERFLSGDEFFWSPPYEPGQIGLSEWYNHEHSRLFVYFDSWDELRRKCRSINYDEQSRIVKEFSEQHTQNTLRQWADVLRQAKQV